MKVDQDRLQEDLVANSKFGVVEAANGVGRTTLTGTDAEKRARDRLVDQMREGGLDVAIDPLGNIEGRWVPDGVDPSVEPIVAGSHLDSVPRGGIFDGPLGVYAALEAVRTIKESGRELERPVSVVSFTGEEGARFQNGLLGSSVVAGTRSLEQALSLEDEQDVTVREALQSIGYNGSDRIDPETWHTWLELHIEQDTVLEGKEKQVGVVDRITGITNCRIEITGEANHAGTTPMYERQDALAAASAFTLAVEKIAESVAESTSETAVGTVGEMHISPNAKNVVSGDVEIIIDIRDVERQSMEMIVDRAKDQLERIAKERDVDVTFNRYRTQPPSEMSDRCIDAAIDAAADNGIPHMVMPSGAMHDTANVSNVTNTGLLFAPSENGISHNPQEWTDWSDCAAATQVLAETMYSLAADASN